MGSKNNLFPKDVLDIIGHTPLIELNFSFSGGQRVFGKAEFINPSGSHKDRIYLNMIEKAEQSGELKKDMVIIEGSTGNAGAACTMIGRQKGYEVIIVMPEGMSEERKKNIKAYGGKIIFTPGGESDQDLSLQEIEKIIKEEPNKYWYPNQFRNIHNPQAHYYNTASEIWEQANGNIDVFVAAVGSGGVLSGVGKYLKEKDPQIKIYAVEPAECPILTEMKWGSHEIQGIGDGFLPDNLELDLVDGVITTSSEESIKEAKKLCARDGLLVGISSGCNIAAVKKLLEKHPSFMQVVTVLFDTGHKYYSSPLFDVSTEVEIPERDHGLPHEAIERLKKFQEDWDIIN